MKRLMIGMLLLASTSVFAAVATVQQIEPGVRPVYNSGTGVMPAGAQEAVPKASRQLQKDNLVGVGFTPVMLGFFTPLQVPGPDFDVGGLRLNLFYSTCCNFDGLDVGLRCFRILWMQRPIQLQLVLGNREQVCEHAVLCVPSRLGRCG